MGENKLKGMICFEFQSVDVQIQWDCDFLKDIRAKTSSNTVSTNTELPSKSVGFGQQI